MGCRKRRFNAIAHFVHQHFLWMLLGSYAVAIVCPGPGMWIRHLSFGEVALLGWRTRLSLPLVMLAFLLFNAGLGVQVGQLRTLWRSPLAPVAGLFANLAVPVAFIMELSLAMQPWYNPEEMQNILVGLALIAAMPIAGSSTAWAQNANGDLALSLGLVLGSTLLSPLTTPMILQTVSVVTTGDYSQELHELATSGADGFLALTVVVPSLLGIAFRVVLGEAWVAMVKPRLKLFNLFLLLLLNFSNASLSLPQAFHHPDWDYLAVILAITVGLCTLAFGTGWVIARLLGLDDSRRTSLMFGLGMNNNGTGLVLASLALANHPGIMLPMIVYNLIQHLIAGVVDRFICQPSRKAVPT